MIRRLLLVQAAALALGGQASADMGIFSSMAQNPVPLYMPGAAASIEMTAEDVFIRMLEPDRARLTGVFLFTNHGGADRVVMYFPVDILVPTVSVLYGLENVSWPLESPWVSVDGRYVEVRPLLHTTWHRWSESVTWEDMLEYTTPLADSEPADREGLFYYLPPSAWESVSMEWSDPETGFPSRIAWEADALMAAWDVDFGPGESVLVEYSMDFYLSSVGYEEFPGNYNLYYPLWTGAAWEGPIGTGRIIATWHEGEVPYPDYDSVLMPGGREFRDYVFEPLPEMEASEAWGSTLLSEVTGSTLRLGLMWEFTDFEPVVTSPRWYEFYAYEDGMDEVWMMSDGEDTVMNASAVRLRFDRPGTGIEEE